jgi:hypothetical protein
MHTFPNLFADSELLYPTTYTVHSLICLLTLNFCVLLFMHTFPNLFAYSELLCPTTYIFPN